MTFNKYDIRYQKILLRQALHLVSSFSHHDMEPGRSNARGVELLRQYLEFAASGGSVLGATTSGVPLNAFELDVMKRLTEKGIPVTPHYRGCGVPAGFCLWSPRSVRPHGVGD